MSLQTRLADFIAAVGADIKAINDHLATNNVVPNAVDGGDVNAVADVVYDGGTP